MTLRAHVLVEVSFEGHFEGHSPVVSRTCRRTGSTCGASSTSTSRPTATSATPCCSGSASRASAAHVSPRLLVSSSPRLSTRVVISLSVPPFLQFFFLPSPPPLPPASDSIQGNLEKSLNLKKSVFISRPGKVPGKNVIPKVWEKSWKCYIHVFIQAEFDKKSKHFCKYVFF